MLSANHATTWPASSMHEWLWVTTSVNGLERDADCCWIDWFQTLNEGPTHWTESTNLTGCPDQLKGRDRALWTETGSINGKNNKWRWSVMKIKIIADVYWMHTQLTGLQKVYQSHGVWQTNNVHVDVRTVLMSESRTLTANAVPQAKGWVIYSSVPGSSSSSWSKNCTLASLPVMQPGKTAQPLVHILSFTAL